MDVWRSADGRVLGVLCSNDSEAVGSQIFELSVLT
jgi:hypothetical protein